MDSKQLDMSEYLKALEKFKLEKSDEIIKHWGSMEKFEDFMQKVKDNESSVAKLAIKQFGSVEKYTEAMKYNIEHFSELMEKFTNMQENKDEISEKSDDLYMELTADMTRDITSDEIQKIVAQIIEFTDKNTMGIDMGAGFWDMIIQSYSDDSVKKYNDDKYGKGASDYITKALQYYLNVNK